MAPTSENTIYALNTILSTQENRQSLSDIQAAIIHGCWQGQSYDDIASELGYQTDYIKRIGAKLWQELSTLTETKITKKNLKLQLSLYLKEQGHQQATSADPQSPFPTHQDWGNAVNVSYFQGREHELETLTHWITQDQCALLAINGVGGIGKTALSIKLAQQIQNHFEVLICRSLKNLPPLMELLAELLLHVSDQQLTELPPSPTARISLLLQYLRKHRCLIVLDNAESLLQSGDAFGQYQPGYEGYGELIHQIGETVHQSCLVLTTRELPEEVAVLAGDFLPVRILNLVGLQVPAAQELLKVKGLSGTESETAALVKTYCGNPLALKISATSIQDIFAGRITAFLDQGIISFNGIQRLLNEQLERLSDVELQVMNWLALHREPVTVEQLTGDLCELRSQGLLLEALEILTRRSLIEKGTPIHLDKTAVGYTLQPVVLEYSTEQFIGQFSDALIQQSLPSINQYALIQVQTHDYIRETQLRLIVEPIIQRLLNQNAKGVEAYLKQFMGSLHQFSEPIVYAAGNLLTLLRYVQADFSDLDLSNLTIQQTDLQGIKLHRVNFCQAQFKATLFSETLRSMFDLTYSPTGDKFAVSDNELIKLYRHPYYEKIATLEGHQVLVWTLSFSADGHLLASGTFDQTIKIWDVETQTCLHTLSDHSDAILFLAFCPQSDTKAPSRYTLASASQDGSVKVWNAETGECLQTIQKDHKPPRSVAFTTTGEQLAIGYFDGSVCVLNQETQEEIWLSSEIDSPEAPIAFSSDNQHLAVGYSNGMIKVWNISRQQCEKILHGHNTQIYSLSFSANAQRLASSAGDDTIRIWDVQAGHCLHCLHGHTARISAVSFHPHQAYLASSSEDNSFRIWDVESGQLIKCLLGHSDGVWSVAVCPRTLLIASGSNDRGLRIWDTQTGECVTELAGHSGQVKSVAYSADGTRLVSATYNAEIKVWDTHQGICLDTFQLPEELAMAIALSQDGQYLAIAGKDNTIHLRDLNTQTLLEPLMGQYYILGLAFSPDGKMLASACSEHTIKLWDLNTYQCLQMLQDQDWIWSVDFHPFEPLLVSGSNDGTVKLWDIHTGKCLIVLEKHYAFVTSVRFSPDGQSVVSGGFDRQVKVWDWQTGNCLQTLVGHADAVHGVEFLPQGRTVVSGSSDETVKVWDVKTGDCVYTLRPPRLYEGMNITGTQGLTPAQMASLEKLGALTQ